MRSDWPTKLENLSKERKLYKKWEQKRREVIADAHDVGGMSHAEIAAIVGIQRGQVIRIVNSIRAERGQ